MGRKEEDTATRLASEVGGPQPACPPLAVLWEPLKHWGILAPGVSQAQLCAACRPRSARTRLEGRGRSRPGALPSSTGQLHGALRPLRSSALVQSGAQGLAAPESSLHVTHQPRL